VILRRRRPSTVLDMPLLARLDALARDLLAVAEDDDEEDERDGRRGS
jgi:hypothetical protein